MLRISKLTDYGTVVMTELARDPLLIISAADLADRLHIQLPTVSKVLKQLSKAKLVQSFRGVDGGYQLGMSAENISVAHIIDALEGPISLTECATDTHSCSQESECGVRDHWQVINGAVLAALQSVTLAEMTKAAPATNTKNVVPLNAMSINSMPITGKQKIPVAG